MDPNGIGAHNGQIYGLETSFEEAAVTVLPVSWDATASYGTGTSLGPQSILTASPQLDLYDPYARNFWQQGIWMAPIQESIIALNKEIRPLTDELIDLLEAGEPENSGAVKQLQQPINLGCDQLHRATCDQIIDWLEKGKLPLVVGGEHSVTYGSVAAFNQCFEQFGVLQIDAHADLRKAYMGLKHSHASVAYNLLGLEGVKKIVQVGVRDFCEEEMIRIENSKGRITTFFDAQLKRAQYRGTNWHLQCEQIVAKLPKLVYITIDIDGLDPKLCPNTGTPVPGGLEFSQLVYLLEFLVASGRKIIGGDLVEVGYAENQWDGNVGARVLYKLAMCMYQSQQEPTIS